MSDVRSYCNPWPPRHSEGAQKAQLTGEVYVEDRGGVIIDALIKSIRKGSIVEVVELGLLAPVKGRPGKRREAIVTRLEAIKARGGTIHEAATGHTSAKQCAKMLLRAYDFIANSGRAVAKYERSGRPTKHKLSPHEWAVAEGIWTSRRYKNDDERLTAIEKRIGKRLRRTWMRNKFGSPRTGPKEA